MKNSFKLPNPLSLNSGIGLVNPAGIVSSAKLKRAIKIIKGAGFKRIFYNKKLKPYRFFSGSDNKRIEDFNLILQEKNINLIFSIRGGYGSIRIIEGVDFEEIIKKKIIFCGYSDISIFHSTLFKMRKLITFYGPMPGVDFTMKSKLKVKKLFSIFSNLGSQNLTYKIDNPNVPNFKPVTGTAFANCLSILQTSIGTRYQPNLEGTILFLEDINEEPYSIERMLMHLYHSKLLKGVKLIVFNLKGPGERSVELKETLLDFEQIAGIHVLTGFKFGHKNPFNLIPIGANCTVINKGNKIIIDFNLRNEGVK
ncbi:LD-carboxypeptidase [Candidatus Dependentiae bacterium]|nr:LD-carboxypeptidase [Candidatus Dependentiae bacterium]